MTNRRFAKSDYLKFGIFLSFAFGLLILLAGEVIARLVIDQSPYKDKADIDEELGWVVQAASDMTYMMRHYQDVAPSYEVHYQTSKYGFRSWGDTSSTKPKVLFIGDSFVQSVEVSNEATFYELIGDSLDIEVFAYGAAGYGTLQQKLILDKYKDIINPDLIVLQTCSNDFVDNHPPMEYASNYKVGIRRPYYNKNKEIYYNKGIPLWQERIDKSAFLKVLRKKLQYLFGNKGPSTESQITRDSTDFLPFKESIHITTLILEDFKKSADNTPIIGWSASRVSPYAEVFEHIFHKADIPFYLDPARMIDRVKWNGGVANSIDGYHWNELGHQTVADALVQPLLLHLKTSHPK